ncbi:MAG: hypothetical protein OEZ10_03145 [Gammaproteobacteria bacterium]|nr:hypothetical protein [Gammaproteobacteria bacterium]
MPGSPVFTCTDIRRLIIRGELKNPALKQHVPQCPECLAFGRKYLKDKKEAEAAGREMKSDPQAMAAQMLAMAEGQRETYRKIPRWLGIVAGFLIAALFLMLIV